MSILLKDAIAVLSNENEPIPAQLHKIMQEMNNSRKAATIFLSKYCLVDDHGKLLETSMDDVWRRVSTIFELVLTEAESNVKASDTETIAKLTQQRKDAMELKSRLFMALTNKEIIPGGRVTFAVGTDAKVSAYNCYVLESPDDSLDGIFDTLRDMAKTMSRGGGVGCDFSSLRPKGAGVENAAKSSTGPVSFMNVYSIVTGTIGQHQRRGAEMITMNVEHPDIDDFIDVKQFDREKIDDTIVSYVRGETSLFDLKEQLRPLYSVNFANISVLLTDKFMDAVEKNKDFEHHWESKDGRKKVTKTMNARDTWNKIVHNAWSTGEPGILFWDRVREEHNGEYFEPVSSTNPCAEQPLPPNGACNLAHGNLAACVRDSFSKKAYFDMERFQDIIKILVPFLDAVVDFNANPDRQALQSQIDSALRDRRIGVGLTGLGDMLFRLGIPYGSAKSKKLLKDIMFTYAHTAYRASIELAKEKGPFPAFKADKFLQSAFMKRLCAEVKESGIDPDFEKDIKKYGVRNVTLLTIAPVGTGSEVLGLGSSGVEPIFAAQYSRKVFMADAVRTYTEHIPVVRDYMATTGKDTLPDYFVTAHDITPEQRVDMQSLMQKYVDTSISSTINLPYSATADDVSRIYQMAWKAGLKSMTVYREGSREDVITTNKGGRQTSKLVRKLFKSSKDLIQPRPGCLLSATYAVSYHPGFRGYITIGGDLETGTPSELLIRTKRVEDKQTADALGILLTALLRRDFAMGVSSTWVVDELNDIVGDAGAYHKDEYLSYPKMIKGLSQAVAHALSLFLEKKYPMCALEIDSPKKAEPALTSQQASAKTGTEDSAAGTEHYEVCPQCRAKAMVKNPCDTCLACGYSKCG